MHLSPTRFLAAAALWTTLAVSWPTSTTAKPGTKMFFVGPEPAGDASGSSAENHAGFRDRAFWSQINPALAQAAVTVTFVPGTYLISGSAARQMPPLQLDGLGNAEHLLTLQGAAPDEVIFTRHPQDPRAGEKGPGFFFLVRCRHVVVRNLAFTAPHVPIGYATNFGGNQDVLVENCHWHDLQGVYFGATGTARESTDGITFKGCRFERVGSGGHAHMIYNAYGPRHIRVIDCRFEDCAGDYIRFRDRTDYALVTGCTFHSTGQYIGVHAPFISIPLFNDDDPAARKPHPGYEYFGTHFLFCNNTFTYDTEEKPASRIAVLFHHSGYNPPGGEFLLDPAEARVLRTGGTAEKKALLLSHLKVNADEVHVYANRSIRVAHAGVYRCQAAYGARRHGGEGMYDIADTFNSNPVDRTTPEARHFFP